jgi:hypothetical protein
MSAVEAVVGGVHFALGPAARLTPSDLSLLAMVGAPPASAGVPPTTEAFRIEIVDTPVADVRQATGSAAVVEWTGGRLLVLHRRFTSELDPTAGVGRLWRESGSEAALPVTLRVALKGRLPLCGGVPVHAAGLVIEDWAAVFFGPSGAGKSTLAGVSPFPVLSDETVSVLGDGPFTVWGTGLWGTLGERPFPRGAFPLAALFELRKGPRLEISRLAPDVVLRKLAGVLLVPAAPPLWSRALPILGRLARGVPCYALSWSPDQGSPWPQVSSLLKTEMRIAVRK